MKANRGQAGLAAIASLLAIIGMPACAERPMAVDDAGTLERGGAKVEFGWSKDGTLKGVEGAVGYGPVDNVEMEIAYARVKDRDAAPDVTVRAVGAAVKWVPLQSESGLSAGLKYEYGRERESGEDAAHANALAGLATWAFEAGPRVHLNLGREWCRGESHADFWGVAADFPLTRQIEFAIETFGEEHAGPDRQVGLRYAIIDGLKVSAAAGRGNGRSIANVGVAWEF
ncbi:hypothetical protein [Thauera linaloolentis]|uniref:Porin domain-containing protein n=1 Tax=Thauera linaloolentis (strain DSM 12138 / JCM 21573 / CCUG 41526 / CIP 105981 / IAM 15112 / NBRC 102519 / 47Lol) TaxID=1123367 RepID=N6Z1Z9_THAL4|nr:hypothetical protein [Thauera linaloolentis]ENO88642.1 hypothetical protein C666_08265 [Thauera linaloolentis 47Lol = DSM 12138]MCM8565687.1 hypothetical protein [Thauera linaloolentis]